MKLGILKKNRIAAIASVFSILVGMCLSVPSAQAAGNAANGKVLYNTSFGGLSCSTAGACHGADPLSGINKIRNGASNGADIMWSISNTGLMRYLSAYNISAAQADDLGAYIANPSAANISGQTIGAISLSPTTLAVGGTTTVSAAATSGLTVSFSSTTQSICTVNGNVVTGVAAGICTIAANQSGNASFSAATQVTQNITVVAAPTQINLVTGWNLLGNSANAPLDVAATLGDATKVTTVWKWIPGTSKWAFYSPSMVAPDLAIYAANKGYEVLSTISGGEGFWVNAKSVFTIQLPAGIAISSSKFADQAAPPNKLPAGWSLIAVGDNPSPRSFANMLATSQPVSPAVAATSLTTLWAWDGGLSSWYFYSPSLDNSGGLAGYIVTKGYLDFAAKGKALDPATGFWVNHP